MKKLLFLVSIILCGMVVMSSCDKTGEPGSNTPPTTVDANIFKTLKSYIGMSESQIRAKMTKLKGTTVSETTESGITTIEVLSQGEFQYQIEVSGATVRSVIFGKYYPNEQGVRDLMIPCSDALAAIAIAGGRYYASSDNTEFKNRSLFLTHLKSNRQKLSNVAEATMVDSDVAAYWIADVGSRSLVVRVGEEVE